VFRHQLEERLPLLAGRAVLLMADAADPTRESVARAAALLPRASSAIGGEGWSPGGLARKAATIADFLASPARAR
jgi:hypothetical protein